MDIILKEDLEKEISNTKGKVIVDFWAEWCGPCKMVAPVLDTLEDVTVLKVNVEDAVEIASDYKVSSIPTLLFFNEGKKVGEKVGMANKESIMGMFA